MRKWLVYLLGGALVLALPGLAVAQSFAAHVTNTDTQTGNVYVRYYTAGVTCNSGGVFNCGRGNCAGTAGTLEGEYCLQAHKDAKNGYRGHTDNRVNYPGSGPSSMFHAIWDTEAGTGTGDHTGYYAWTCKTVLEGQTHQWFNDDCSGTKTAADCLGNSYAGVAADRANTPQGTLLRHGGLSAVPVPTVASVNNTIIDLDWDDVSGVGCGEAATYDLYYYIDDLSDSACDMPNEGQFTFLGNYSASTATVDTATDLGGDSFGKGEAKGIVFALKLVYPTPAEGQAETRYFSANGQCVSLDTALAAEVYDLVVRHAGRNNVEVSWKTSLEDGVRGFYVTRATSENGPYTRVSDLVAANGEPSAYSFIDTITAPRGRVHASGVFYKIEALDIDDNVQNFGPAALELPTSVRPRGTRPAPIRRR